MEMIFENIFLLGGYDLEMTEIRSILIDHGYQININLFDKHLTWGAKWSDYNDVVEAHKEKNISIFGIELKSNNDLPKNCFNIDHHAPLPAQPTSIEQVATVLKIVLTRKQLLIAANDYGHINALKIAGATVEEIIEIRLLDRRAQGVTDEEEYIANLDIVNPTFIDGITVINTQIKHFSAITDKVAYEKLLIYNDNKFCYYGIGAKYVAENLFKNEIKIGNMYNGGGEHGYLGSAEGIFSKKYIKDVIIEQIALFTNG